MIVVSGKCSPFLLPCALTACLGVLTTIINIFFLEETLPKLKKHSGKQYSSMQAKEEDAREEYAPRMSISLSRALTSPDSINMSETAGERLLDVQQKDVNVCSLNPTSLFPACVTS